MCAVEFSDLPALHSFVRGLHKDLDAGVAGLSLPRSALVRAGATFESGKLVERPDDTSQPEAA